MNGGFQIFAICLVGGVCLSLAYGLGRAERRAIGIIVLSVILSPLYNIPSDFDPNSLLSDTRLPDGDNAQLGAVIEQAFADGIACGVAEKFSLNVEDIRIRIYGFDYEALRCDRIRIILSGRAALADYKAIEKYVNGMDIGECDVEIEIG